MTSKGKGSVRKQAKARAERQEHGEVTGTTEEKLRQSQERYRSLFDRTLDGVYLSTHEGRFVDVNPAFVKMFGYSSKQEMLEIKDIKKELYFSPEERGSHILDTGQTEVDVYRMRRKDGSEIWVEDHGRYIHDANGKVNFHEGIIRDVTERKRTQETLRDSEEKFRMIFLNSPLGIFRSTFDGHLLEVNPVMARMFGYDSPEKMIREVDDVAKQLYVRAEDRGRIVTSQLRSNDVTQHLNHYRRRDGSEFIANLCLKTVRDAEGRPIHLEGIVEDVTERRIAEQKLRLQAQIAGSMFEGLVLIREADGVIVHTNPQFDTMFGYAAGELIGKNIAIANAPTDGKSPEEIAMEIQSKLRETGSWSGELRNVRKDGVAFWCQANVTTLESSEYGPIWIATHQDITERKRLMEAARRRAQELGSLQETLLEITGRHELSQLLNSIVERAAELLGAPGGGLYLCDPDRQEVRCVVAYNTIVNSVGVVLKYGEGAAGVVAQTGQPLIIDDYQKWPSRASIYEKDRPFGAVVSAPMKWQGQVIGVIHVLRYDTKRFTESDLELLTMFANHASIAVQNARLYEQLDQHANQLETLIKERSGKLAESERRFRELAELLPQIVFEADENGVFTFVNHVGLASTGYTEDDLRSRNMFQLVPPDEYGKVSEAIARQNEREPLSVEINVMRKDGSVFPALVYASAILRDKKIVGFRGIAVDITERKRMEEELRSARERLEHVVTTNPAAIYAGKPLPDYSDWRLTYISDRVTTMLGYEPQAFIGDPEFWQTHVHRDDLSPAMKAVPHIFKEGGGATEYRFLHKDGTYRWIRDRVRVIHDVEGKPVEVNGYWSDITELKRSEEAKRESEARYRRLFESSPISLWEEDFSEVKEYFDDLRGRGVKDLRRHFIEHPEELAKCASMVKVLDVNEATLKLYGAASVNELLGELRRVLTEDPKENYREELVALWDGEKRFSSEFENQTLAGEMKHVDVIVNVVPGYDETLGKVLVSVIDLTERKKMEEQLKGSRDRLEHVLATNPAVLYAEEPLADFSDTVSTFVSESARFVLGFEPKMFLGESGLSFWRSRVHPDDLARYWAELPSLWRDEHHTFEYRFLHSDGSYRWISEQYRVIRDAQGSISSAVAVAIDITERKRLEEKLAKTERFAAIGETAAMVGHDLRNPLQGIAGAVHILRQESLTASERDEMLQVIEKSVAYSDAIVRDLADYSAEIRLNLAEATPKGIVGDALRMAKVPASVMVRDLTEDTPKLSVDTDRMRRVFSNLFENAIDAMPQGGTVTARSRHSDGMVEISLSDTGSGMAEEVMENLWKPLQTTKAKGLGLGLAICKRIVEAHGGRIFVKSKLGEGTIVTVRLPVQVDLVEVSGS